MTPPTFFVTRRALNYRLVAILLVLFMAPLSSFVDANNNFLKNSQDSKMSNIISSHNYSIQQSLLHYAASTLVQPRNPPLLSMDWFSCRHNQHWHHHKQHVAKKKYSTTSRSSAAFASLHYSSSNIAAKRKLRSSNQTSSKSTLFLHRNLSSDSSPFYLNKFHLKHQNPHHCHSFDFFGRVGSTILQSPFSSFPSTTMTRRIHMVPGSSVAEVFMNDEECVLPPEPSSSTTITTNKKSHYSTRSRNPRNDFSVRGTIMSGDEGYSSNNGISTNGKNALNSLSEGNPNNNNHDGREEEEIVWVDALGENVLCHEYNELQLRRHEEEQHLPHEQMKALSSMMGGGGPKPLSILTWNILAQSLYESHYDSSPSSSSSSSDDNGSDKPLNVNNDGIGNDIGSRESNIHPHPWPKRLQRILQTISQANSDIVCLQECELHLFERDLVPAMWEMGYEGVAQEDDRPTASSSTTSTKATSSLSSQSSSSPQNDENDSSIATENFSTKPTNLKEVTKHRDPRNHIVATFWKRGKFQVVGEAYVRTRSLTTVLRLKGNPEEDYDGYEDKSDSDDDSTNNASKTTKASLPPTVAVVNCHLEGNPRKFSARTHQLQGALLDLSKRIQRETSESQSKHKKKKKKNNHKKKQQQQSSSIAQEDGDNNNDHRHQTPPNIIGQLNALLIAGDFNCELQSSACSTYLRIGRLGRQAGLGGIHGEDSLVLPPSLLETNEANDVLHPIMEWGRALPDDRVADVAPHPFRRNGMMSAYPVWLGRDDAREHFTFCGEMSKRPVPGLDQIWFSSLTLERVALRRMFVDHLGEWRSGYDENVGGRADDDHEEDAEIYIERRRDEERKSVLRTGLPDPECKYPSDHLPIGCMFDWKLDANDEACIIDEESEHKTSESSSCVEAEVRGLKVVDAEGNIIEQLNSKPSNATTNTESQSQIEEFGTPQEELEYHIENCPFDSEQQKLDVCFILSPINPPLSAIHNTRPTPEQLVQINDRRDKKAEVLATSSLAVRPWLKNIWKASKKVGAWERDEEKKKLVEKESDS